MEETGHGEIQSSYNYGSLSSSNVKKDCTGGIIGSNSSSGTQGIITNSYYTDTSTTYSHYNNTNYYTTGKITENDLKDYTSKLNEKDEEGNEIEVWVNDTGINKGYPILKWQIEQN